MNRAVRRAHGGDPAGKRLSALLPVAPDLQVRRSAPPFCTRGDPVCEDATGSSRFWSPTAPGGHMGCIVQDVGRGTLSDRALTSDSLQRIVGGGFSLG